MHLCRIAHIISFLGITFLVVICNVDGLYTNIISCNLDAVEATHCTCYQTNPSPSDLILVCEGLRSTKGLYRLLHSLRQLKKRPNSVQGLTGGLVFEEFHLVHNTLVSLSLHDLKDFGNFKILNLSNNHLVDIAPRSFTNLSVELQILDLSANNLTEVKDWFDEARPLSALYLTKNLITLIWAHAFVPLEKLKVLDLSYNQLAVIQDDWFSNLSSLANLSLAHNRLEMLQPESFLNLHSLMSLDLSHNKLKEIPGGIFATNSALSYISLADNRFDALPSNLFDKLNKLRDVFLIGNNWTCDNSLLWLHPWIKIGRIRVAPERERVFCEAPEDMKGFTIQHWSGVVEMEESFHNSSICKICHCYVEKMRAVSVVDCKGKGLDRLPEQLPRNTRLVHLEDNRIKSVIINPNFAYEWQNVTFLHLDGNRIDSLKGMEGSGLIKRLAVLHLTSNNLREIPIYLMDQFTASLGEIKLARNPWVCDCNTVLFQMWLQQHYKQVKDVEEIRCALDGSNSGRVLFRLMKSELCPQQTQAINFLDILNSFMGILIIIFVSKLLYDYWWQKRTGKLPHFFKLNFR